MTPDKAFEHSDTRTFCDGIYQDSSVRSDGKPSKILERVAKDLEPGTALDLGCAKGDDAVWLAKKGWRVTAIDVSSIVLTYAAQNAQRAAVADRISFERHDLSRSFPDGRFDLACASFFYSPTPLLRAEIFRQVAAPVVSGGHLLIIDHGSRAPWSWAAKDTVYPTAAEALQALDLSVDTWRPMQIEDVERIATGPGGQKATVSDTVIFLVRL